MMECEEDEIDFSTGLDDLGLEDLIDMGASPPKGGAATPTTNDPFLSWLDDTEVKTNDVVVAPPAVALIREDISKRVKEIQESPSYVPPTPISSTTSASEEVVSRLASLVSMTENQSSTLDIDAIRDLCIEAGSIPHLFRIPIWKKMLKVDSTPPVSFNASTTSAVTNRENLASEVDQLVINLSLQLPDILNEEQRQNDLRNSIDNLVTLLCQRRSISYPLGLCAALAPLFLLYVSEKPLVELSNPDSESASELFHLMYAAVNAMLPHVLLDSTASISQSQRSALRLLLLYHSPELALWMDQHHPSWNEDDSEVLHQSSVTGLLQDLVPDLSLRLVLFDRFLLNDPISPSYPVFFTLAAIMKFQPHLKSNLTLTSLRRAIVEDLLVSAKDIIDVATFVDKNLLAQTPVSVIETISAGSCIESTPPFFSLSLDAAEVSQSVISGRRSRRYSDNSGGGESIRYFVIDVRTASSSTCGALPTAFRFDPMSLTNDSLTSELIDTLNPIRRSVHICIMGQGSYTANASEDEVDNATQDVTQINDVVLFLTKKGFPYISVLSGGYTAVHKYLYTTRHNFSLDDLADHACQTCSECVANDISQDKNHFSDDDDEASNDSGSQMMMSSIFSEKLKGGKSWLQKKKSVAGDKLISAGSAAAAMSTTTANLNDGKKWLMKKTEEMELKDAAAKSGKSIAASIGSSFSAIGGSIKRHAAASPVSSSGNNAPLEHASEENANRSVTVDASIATAKNAAATIKSSSLDGARKMTSRFKTTFSSLRAASSSSSPSTADTTLEARARHSVEKSEDNVFTIGGEDDDDEAEEDDEYEITEDLSVNTISELTKGIRVISEGFRSLTGVQMFFCHKKKKRNGMTVLRERYLGIISGYLLVLKTSVLDDTLFIVKSNHHLSLLTRMTQFKKNKLLVALYFSNEYEKSEDSKLKPHNYQLQERDRFIEKVKEAMESLVVK